jgi:PAS domain S-box-containing protein
MAAEPLLDGKLPYFFFVVPLVFTCWLGGFWPGLLATGLSLVFGYRFLVPGEPVAIHAVSFGLLGVAFSLVFDWSQKAGNVEWIERRNAEERVQFLVDLNDALLPLDDVRQIMAVSVRMLGEYLGVQWCGYAEAEAGREHFLVLADYIRDGPSREEGDKAPCEFGDEGRRKLRKNLPYIVNDVEKEFPPGQDLLAYRQAQIRSLACVPLKKEGSFVARIAVHQETPRRWSNEEIKIITIVANRCWESAARARAARRLKDSDERHRAFISNSSEAIWRYELDSPIPVALSEDQQVGLFYQRAYLAECNEAFARMHGRASAAEMCGERLTVLLIRSDPEKIIEYSRAFVRSGYHLMGAETLEVDIYGNAKYFLSNLTGIVENGELVRAWGTQRDITEQKEAENALKASEERLRRITEATQDALWEIDLKTNQLWWSEGARPLFGLIPSERQIGLDDWYEHIHPDDVDRVRSRFEDFMKSDADDWADEYRFRRADGFYVYIHDRGCKFRDDRGTPLYVAGAMADITERRMAETAIRESEERFSKAFRASPDCLVISRIADGFIVEVNDSFASLAGYRRDELIGHRIPMGLYADPMDRQRMVALLKEQNYVRDFEFEMKTRSGEVRLMRFSAEPLELGGEHCWLTIGHDITESKRAEEALRRSEEEARRQLAYVEAIYATAPVGLCFVGTDLRFHSINERLAEIDGTSVHEHLGRTLREAVPDIADAIEPLYRRVIETGRPILNIELSLPVGSGPMRHFLASYYPIKNNEGGVLGVNVVVVEITERKGIEETLERLLRQEKAAREEAETANRLKDEFLATVSHELRTPLTAIVGWTSMLLSGSLPPPLVQRALDVIARSAKSQSEMIADVLDMSRIVAGRLKLDLRPLEIESVFQAAVEVIRPSAQAKGIALLADLDGRHHMVLGDASRLQQVIWNLLSNAVKFTNEGGHIEARLTCASGQAEITITDSGAGIEQQFVPYLFERFRQADSSSTRRYGGLGLGLAIVRNVVEMHGGRVSASSPGKGEGSTFKISLPLMAAAGSPQGEVPATESKPGASAFSRPEERGAALDHVRVLVVEDDPDTLDLLKIVLDNSGADVATAASVSEAIDTFEQWRPDVLVSDLAMPEQDGYQLIGQVRSRAPERGGNTPAVALTAYARNEDRKRALAAGFQMHLAKPIAPKDLIAALASLSGRAPQG